MAGLDPDIQQIEGVAFFMDSRASSAAMTAEFFRKRQIFFTRSCRGNDALGQASDVLVR
jgi:hypothetical protein